MSDFQAIADRVEIGDTASGRMRSQINLTRAAADPRSRRGLGEQI